MNAQNHRVAAGDVDFSFRPDGNSGAFCCYLDLFDAASGKPIHLGCDVYQRVVQTTLWKNEAGEFFEVRYTPINVDEHVHRREALKKLTDAEKRALGVSR